MDKTQKLNKLPLLKILIVDDTDSIRLLVREYLKKIESVTVVEAENRDEAINKVKEFTPDVVLMDISLGGISGLDVTRQIKSDFPGIRVYLFSAYNPDEYGQLKNESLCDGFIRKTSLKTELQQMIQTELNLKN